MDWLTEALNSIYEYLIQPDLWIGLGQTVLKIIAIVILAYAFKHIGYRVIDGVFKDKKHISLNNKSDGKREQRSEEHTSELQSRGHLVCRLLLEKKKQ